MIKEKDFIKGEKVVYSDFYDKSYSIIKLVEITKRNKKKGLFWFNAEIVDNSNLDGKRLACNANGTIRSFSNSFIYKDIKDLKIGSENYKNKQIKWLESIEKMLITSCK